MKHLGLLLVIMFILIFVLLIAFYLLRGLPIKSSDDFKKRMEFILADPYIARIAGEVSRVFIQGSRGATDRIMKHLNAIPKD